MSTLDGYSGIATAYTSFSGTLDESTVIAGDTVRVFQGRVGRLLPVGIIGSSRAYCTGPAFRNPR